LAHAKFGIDRDNSPKDSLPSEEEARRFLDRAHDLRQHLLSQLSEKELEEELKARREKKKD
jgi:hypothetical protein